MRLSLIAYALAGLVLSACSSDPGDPAFEYDEGDMSAAIVGTHEGTLSVAGQPDTALTLVIERAEPSARPLCGNRTFAQPLCIDASTLSLGALLTTADGAYTDAKLEGSFNVYGLKFTGGELQLSGEGASLSATYDGRLTEGHLSGSSEGEIVFAP